MLTLELGFAAPLGPQSAMSHERGSPERLTILSRRMMLNKTAEGQYRSVRDGESQGTSVDHGGEKHDAA